MMAEAIILPPPFDEDAETGFGVSVLFPPSNTMVGMASGVEDGPQADKINTKRVMAIKYIFFIYATSFRSPVRLL
jgi:hypothetical protein